MSRESDLAKIHIGAKAIGLDVTDRDPKSDYRSMLRNVAGVDSSAELDASGRKTVLDHLVSHGWKPFKTARRRARPQSSLIYHLWNSLADAGAVQAHGLGAWLISNTARHHPPGWARPEFLPPEVSQGITEQLKQWCKRLNINWRK